MLFKQLGRREFITLLGAAAAWPMGARAQQGERMRRIGVLMSLTADDPEGQARIAAFLQGLQQLGWSDGRNVRIDARWGAGNAEEIRKYAAELVALTPDVILASGGSVVGPLLQVIRTSPIVFTQTPDPVGAGYVDSLARPLGALAREGAIGFVALMHMPEAEVRQRRQPLRRQPHADHRPDPPAGGGAGGRLPGGVAVAGRHRALRAVTPWPPDCRSCRRPADVAA